MIWWRALCRHDHLNPPSQAARCDGAGYLATPAPTPELRQTNDAASVGLLRLAPQLEQLGYQYAAASDADDLTQCITSSGASANKSVTTQRDRTPTIRQASSQHPSQVGQSHSILLSPPRG